MSRANGHLDDSSKPSDADEGSETDGSAVTALEAEVSALKNLIRSLRDELEREREQRQTLEATLETQADRLEDLEADVADLDGRRDLLRLVQDSDEMPTETRQVALIQYLYRTATTRRERGDPAKAAVTRDDARKVLHEPDIDRTTYYSDFDRAASRVDGDVLEYSDGELKMDLTAGDHLLTGATVNGRGFHRIHS